MIQTLGVRINSTVGQISRNPHFWIVLSMSILLLLIYRAWPWREWQFTDGIWRLFPWLSALDFLVVDIELRFRVFGVLFLIPIIYGSLVLSWPGGVFAWLLSLIWVLPTFVSWGSKTWMTSLIVLLLPALLVAIVTLERKWRENEKKSYIEREQERRAYIARLVETQEAERGRIAQEIHDETLQTLMVIANKADSLAASGSDEGQVRGNLWIKKEVLHTTDDLRRISMNLRPSILDNFGLMSGIRWLVNNNNTQHGCHLEISAKGKERKLSDLAEVTVFRVIQEAIRNIQRHANAQAGSVTIDFQEDRLVLTVEDNGVGFQPPRRLAHYVNQSKLGIIGMEQRILSVGGQMHLDSSPGDGTRLWAAIPYSASSSEIVQSENSRL
jgi:signal transduction histidine kinase